MLEQVKPPSLEMKTVKSLRGVLKSAEDVTIVGFFSGESDALLEVYQDAGLLFYDININVL